MKRLLALTLAGVLLISLFVGGIKLSANAEEPTTTVETLRLQPFDSLDGCWTTVADGLALHTEGMKQGTGYITRGCWENIICNNTFVNKDLTGYENGWVRLWLYVSDAGVLATGVHQQEISLKTDDATMYTWDLRGTLQTGWNDLKLPFANAVSTGDITNVNTLQTVFYATADVVIGLDDLRVEREVPGNIKTGMMQNCDSNTGFWGLSTVDLVSGKSQEGTGHVVNTGDTVIICNNTFAMTDLTEYASGWIRAWIYISDVNNLGTDNNQQVLDLKTDDATMYRWDLRNVGLKTGWNDVKLPFANAVTVGNIANVNTLQLVFYCSTATTVGVDALRVEYEVIPTEPKPTEPEPTEPEPTEPEPTEPEPTEPEPTEPKPTEPEPTYIEFTTIDKVNSAEGWSGWFTYDFVEFPPSGMELDTADKKEGEGSLKVHNGGVAAFSRTFGPMDLSAYKDAGYLHLWFYVDDVTKLNEASIELTSSGDADQQEISWVLSGLNTGWNELYLPVAESTAQGGNIDWTAVNYIRVVTNGEVTAGVDDISMCNYGIPQTGDLFFGLAVAALTLSAAAITGTVVIGRKKRS